MSRSSIARPEDDVAQLRDKVESLNRELFHAELQLDVLWRAMTLSKKNIQRVVEERADTISRINKRRTLPQVPKEIILKIAGYLPWNDSYDDEGLTPVRRMARAFSAVRGMEDAILRKLPLVVQHLPPSHWNCSDAYLPKGYMDIIGSRPRICRYDDEDTISRVTRNEEVYLTLPSESHASNISTAVFQRLAAGRLHLSLIDSTAHGFRDFKTSFLNQKILPHITSLIVQRDSGSTQEGYHRSYILVVGQSTQATRPCWGGPDFRCGSCKTIFPLLDISLSLKSHSPPIWKTSMHSSKFCEPLVHRCKVCTWLAIPVAKYYTKAAHLGLERCRRLSFQIFKNLAWTLCTLLMRSLC